MHVLSWTLNLNWINQLTSFNLFHLFFWLNKTVTHHRLKLCLSASDVESYRLNCVVSFYLDQCLAWMWNEERALWLLGHIAVCVDVACCYRQSSVVCLLVCQSQREPFKNGWTMSFGMWTQVGPKNHVWGFQSPTWRGSFEWERDGLL